MCDWFANGCNRTDLPQIKEETFAAILVRRCGIFRLESKLVPMPINAPFHAIGNGRDFAITAMRLGRSPIKAIEITSEFDVFTGGRVTSVSLPD